MSKVLEIFDRALLKAELYNFMGGDQKSYRHSLCLIGDFAEYLNKNETKNQKIEVDKLPLNRKPVD